MSNTNITIALTLLTPSVNQVAEILPHLSVVEHAHSVLIIPAYIAKLRASPVAAAPGIIARSVNVRTLSVGYCRYCEIVKVFDGFSTDVRTCEQGKLAPIQTWIVKVSWN